MFAIGAAFHLVLHLPCFKRTGLEDLTEADLIVREIEQPKDQPVAV